MNVICLGIILFLNLPKLLFQYIHKDNRKIGKRLTILEYIARIANIINIGAMLFLVSFASFPIYYIWLITCLGLLCIYYYIFYQYYTTNNLHYIYGHNKPNLPTAWIELLIPIITGLLSLQIILMISSFVYAVLHYHLETEIQKRVRF